MNLHQSMATPPFTAERRKRIKPLLLITLASAMMALAGCNSATTGALLGAAIGSAAGAGIDHNNRGRGALIGAGVGAATGYIFGNEADKANAYNNSRGGYHEPAPAYYEPAPAYYAPRTHVHIDYYDYCPPPRYHHHHHHHRGHW